MFPSLRTFLFASAVAGLCLAPRLDAQSADLSVLVDGAPNPVAPGGTVTYSITVNNKGPDDAAAAALSDPLPAGTTFQSLMAPGGWSCSTPAVGSGGTVSCTAATLATGSAVFTLAVQVGAGTAAGTVLDNTVTVSSATADPAPGNETATAFTTVGAASAGLTMTITDAPDPVVAGFEVAYTVTVSTTITDGTNAVVTIPPPPGTDFVSLAPPAGWVCPSPPMPGSFPTVCQIAALPVGDSVFVLTVRVPAAAAAGSTVTDTASIVVETDGRTAVATDSEDTLVAEPVAISGTKTVAGQLIPGSAVTYTIVLTNTSSSPQGDNPGDELTDILPPELTLVSASATAGTAAANPGTNTVTWNGAIPAGGSVTITIQATVTPGPPASSASNQATFFYDANGDGSNESSGVTDDPGAPGTNDPTVLRAVAIVDIPVLDVLGVALLTALLAVIGARRLGRA